MSPPLPIKVTRRAEREIRAGAAWWAANRPKAPDAFGEEIERAFLLLSRQPSLGTPARNTKLAGVRRLLLDRIRYYLYYCHRQKPPAVEILALWHTSRGSQPRL